MKSHEEFFLEAGSLPFAYDKISSSIRKERTLDSREKDDDGDEESNGAWVTKIHNVTSDRVLDGVSIPSAQNVRLAKISREERKHSLRNLLRVSSLSSFRFSDFALWMLEKQQHQTIEKGQNWHDASWGPCPGSQRARNYFLKSEQRALRHQIRHDFTLSP